MAKISCFSALVGRKKKFKGKVESLGLAHKKKDMGTLQVKLEHPVKTLDTDGLNSTCFSVSVPFGIQKSSTCKVKVVSDGSPVGTEAVEAAYEGGDEHDENLSIKRELSDFDLQAHVANKGEETDLSRSNYDFIDTEINDEGDAEVSVDLIRGGHVSDPGIEREFWASPTLKRSCSNLETSHMVRKIAAQLPLSKSQSFEDSLNFTDKRWQEAVAGGQDSPVSVMTPCSADRVMLKKHSSSQVLPSRSRRLWWKLFLWSHRNLHKQRITIPRPPTISHNSNQKGGYCSDTLELSQGSETGKLGSPASFTRECKVENNQKWDPFHGGISGSWPQNQWVAFSIESSPLTRVDEWVNSLDDQTPILPNDDEAGYEDGGSPARSITHMTRRAKFNTSEEVLYANNVIQSLNSSSTVAHIAGMSLKVIPTISHLSSLRSVNLSGNFIVRITPGSLPKGLHTLNLSRNKFVAIEGLRELTRLRVLDLSYNKISRIGQGLSNCTLIKELYLAGNKISDVEGLHRLLKLTVLDLSFNKITTAKALGQLVANYNTLQALNVLGNPIQGNIGDDQLRKVVLGLLPQLTYLNKQPIKQQRAREVAMDSVAKAALGNNGRTSRRKVRRVGQSGTSSSSVHRSSGGGRQNSRHKSKSKQRSSAALASH